jgi:hypothetical protein
MIGNELFDELSTEDKELILNTAGKIDLKKEIKMRKHIKLKRCPFCGGKAKVHKEFNSIWGIECKKCKLFINSRMPYLNKKRDLIKYWNSRPSNIISVKDKLPPEGRLVLVYDKSGSPNIGLYSKNIYSFEEKKNKEGWLVGSLGQILYLEENIITWWTEIPEAPKRNK